MFIFKASKHSPTPYPDDDWNALCRAHGKDKLGLPAPVHIPLQVCSLDPELFAPQYKYTPGGQVTQVLLSKFHKDRAPFGYLLGCHTSLGPVRMPSCPVNGYLFDGVSYAWVIAAFLQEQSVPLSHGLHLQ